MNVIQYSKYANILDYLKRWNVEKIIVRPEMEEEVKNSELAELIEEKNFICFSPEAECVERKATASRTKTTYGKKQTEDLTAAKVIVERLKEEQEEGEVDYNKVARLGRQMTDFAKLDKYTPRIHKLLYVPERPKKS